MFGLKRKEIILNAKRPKLDSGLWHKFCFLDESGSLNDPQSPFFTLGFFKISQPSHLLKKIRLGRQKMGFFDEMHFNKLSARNIDFAKKTIDAIFDTGSIQFHSYTLDKKGPYFNKTYGGDPWRAYEGISIKLFKSTTARNEMITILADYVDTPPYIDYETTVRKSINESENQFIVSGIVRLDSKCNDLLQAADLIIGAINYHLKIETGVVLTISQHKEDLTNYLLAKLGVKEFCGGFRGNGFNIFVDKDINLRLLPKEKGPSS